MTKPTRSSRTCDPSDRSGARSRRAFVHRSNPSPTRARMTAQEIATEAMEDRSMRRGPWIAIWIAALLAGCGGTSPPQKRAIGEACPNGTSDCMPGLQCAGEDPGGGQCFKPCTPSTDADCGDTTQFACSFEGHCYLKCTTTSD